MNWGQAAAVGVVANQFALGEQAKTVLDLAIAAESFRRQFVKPKPKMPRPYMPGQRPYKRQRVGPTGAVGRPIAIERGSYLGSFKKRRESVKESANSLIGFHSETENYGTVTNKDTSYIGVSSVNLPMVIRPIAVALLRRIFWDEYKVTFPREDSYLYENTDGTSRSFYYYLILVFRSTGNFQADLTWVTKQYALNDATTSRTLGQVAGDIALDMISGGCWGSTATTAKWEFYGYQFQTNAAVRTPVRVLVDAKVNLSVLQVLNLQNKTPGDDGSYSKDIIGANPVHGKVFTFKGRYPVVENDDYAGLYVTGTAGNSLVQNTAGWPHSFTSDFVGSDVSVGIIVPKYNPPVNWKSPPNPQVFSNCIKSEVGLRLEPGDIKKDILRFVYRGRINDLVHGLRAQSFTLTTNALPVKEMSDYCDNNKGLGVLGTCKLFAFEKLVPTGASDNVVLNYHVDRYIRCDIPGVRSSLSVQRVVETNKNDVAGAVIPGA